MTTTDILQSINRTLQERNEGSSYFELQRRLPDGSTRKASPAEQAAADCQTRLQQATQWLASLPTRAEQYEWAEVQRCYGNQLYQEQQYENAINVYLTCLPVVGLNHRMNHHSDIFESEEQNSQKGNHEHEDDEEDHQQRLLLYCKIMNNLAQSALQLQWYRKAETFCTMALDYYSETQQHVAHPEQIAKLYFRRGKARKCRDEYKLAKMDYERAFELVSNKLERNVIQTELRNVQEKAKQAKQNQQQQKVSLRQVMMTKHSNESDSPNKEGGLFNTPSVPLRKAYSTLRAPRRAHETVVRREQQQYEDQHEKEENLLLQLSFWEYYLAMAGRVAQYLLHLLGDDDDNNNNNNNNQASRISTRMNTRANDKLD